jgi:hypothetical protein
MEKYFDRLMKINERQIEFGRLLGVNLTGLPLPVASAMINEVVEKKFWGKEPKPASQKQIEFGKKFNFDSSELSDTVASGYICHILAALDLRSIEEQNIKPGDCVINKYDPEREYIASSISDDGRTVYFKKNRHGRKGGVARYLQKVNKNVVQEPQSTNKVRIRKKRQKAKYCSEVCSTL